MIYDLAPFTSEYRAVASGGMAAMEQRDGLIGARRSDGCMLSTRQGDAAAPDLPQFHVYDIQDNAGTISCLVKKGWALGRDPVLAGDAIAAPVLPTISGTAMATTRIVIEVTKTLYCRVVTDENDIVLSATIVSETARPTSRHAQPARQDIDMAVTLAAVTGIYYYPIADFVAGPTGRLVVANQYQSGGPIIHIPGRNGHSSSLRIVDCEGTAVAFLNFFQGLETTNLGDQEVEAGCDGGTSTTPP